jgi:hypothetical protein
MAAAELIGFKGTIQVGGFSPRDKLHCPSVPAHLLYLDHALTTISSMPSAD